MHLDKSQRGHGESKSHHGRLRDHEQLALVHVVSNYAADESKEQNGNGRAEADHAQPESGVGELKHEPALGDVLHPGADVGEEVTGPEETEVTMAQGAGDARDFNAGNFNDRGFSSVSYCALG